MTTTTDATVSSKKSKRTSSQDDDNDEVAAAAAAAVDKVKAPERWFLLIILSGYGGPDMYRIKSDSQSAEAVRDALAKITKFESLWSKPYATVTFVDVFLGIVNGRVEEDGSYTDFKDGILTISSALGSNSKGSLDVDLSALFEERYDWEQVCGYGLDDALTDLSRNPSKTYQIAVVESTA